MFWNSYAQNIYSAGLMVVKRLLNLIDSFDVCSELVLAVAEFVLAVGRVHMEQRSRVEAPW